MIAHPALLNVPCRRTTPLPHPEMSVLKAPVKWPAMLLADDWLSKGSAGVLCCRIQPLREKSITKVVRSAELSLGMGMAPSMSAPSPCEYCTAH